MHSFPLSVPLLWKQLKVGLFVTPSFDLFSWKWIRPDLHIWKYKNDQKKCQVCTWAKRFLGFHSKKWLRELLNSPLDGLLSIAGYSPAFHQASLTIFQNFFRWSGALWKYLTKEYSTMTQLGIKPQALHIKSSAATVRKQPLPLNNIKCYNFTSFPYFLRWNRTELYTKPKLWLTSRLNLFLFYIFSCFILNLLYKRNIGKHLQLPKSLVLEIPWLSPEKTSY